MVSDGARSEAAGDALALLVARRASITEKAALSAHDALAAEGVSFPAVREACERAIGLLELQMRDPRAARQPLSELERDVIRVVQAGVPVDALLRALLAGLASVLAAGAGTVVPALDALVEAAGHLAQRLGGSAVAESEAGHRAQLRRRAALADRIRGAAGALAAAVLDLDEAVVVIGRAAAEGLRCDWSIVALPDADGRLDVSAVVGRPASWGQRFELRADGGLGEAALAAPASLLIEDAAAIPFHGEGAPTACIAVGLRDASRRPIGLVLCGRDVGEPLGPDDASLADGVGEIASRTLEAARSSTAVRRLASQLAAIRSAGAAALAGDHDGALTQLAQAAARLTECDVALVRLRADDGSLVTRAVSADSPALAAQLAATTVTAVEGVLASVLSGGEVVFEEEASGPLVAARPLAPSGRLVALGIPIGAAPQVVGVLQLMRARREPFSDAEREHARHVAAQLALLVALGRAKGRSGGTGDDGALAEALAAAGDRLAVARALARHGAAMAGAARAVVYGSDGERPEPLAVHGLRPDDAAGAAGAALALDALRRGEPVLTGGEGAHALAGRGGAASVLSLPLRARSRTCGVLQLLFASPEGASGALATRAVGMLATRGGEALARAQEAERTRAQLERATALADAVAPRGGLSAWGLTRAAVRLAGADAGGVWLREADGALVPGHLDGALADATALVSGLLDEAQGDGNRRDGLATDSRLAAPARLAGATSAVTVPLRVGDDEVGVLALFGRDRVLPPSAEEAGRRLAPALAGVLAAEERGRRLLETGEAAELLSLEAAQLRLGFGGFMRLADAALEGGDRDAALAAASAEATGVGTVAVQVLGDGGLIPRALHVARDELRPAVERVLDDGLDLAAPEVARALAGETVVLDATAGAGLLGPFLRTGSSAALVPVGPPGSVRGVLVLVSLDPTHPVTAEATALVRRLAAT